MTTKRLKEYRRKLRQISLLEFKVSRLKERKNNDEKIARLLTTIDELKLDIQEIDIALECLSENEMYLLKEHYIMGREWLDIERTYNKHFKEKPEIFAEALRKKASRAVKSFNEFYKLIDQLEEVI